MEFLSGSSEMDGLIRSTDWSQNPLGPPEKWPNSLKIVVRMMLDSRYAIWIGWGPELTFLYNDAYARMTLGKKHPWALGKPAREVWAEAWDTLGVRVEEVVQHRQATYDEDLLLLLERSGYPEETYHTFSYSPIPDDRDEFGGLLCIVVEDTAHYLAERRLKTQRDLAAGIAEVRNEEDLCVAIRAALDANRHDFPFSAFYLAEEAGETWRRVCHTGVADESAASPRIASRAELSSIWPIGKAIERDETTIVEQLPVNDGGWPTEPWGVEPQAAIVMPIAQQGQTTQAGLLIVGLNVRRPLDEPYLGFLEMVSRQIEAGLADVRAYENARQRAERLAEIDRAKTVFFSNTSHEFRTPLSLILGPLEAALTRSAGESTVALKREELEQACRNGDRLLRLVNSLLDFSRIEAGRVQSVFEPVNLAAYTAELASSFQSAMEQAGLQYVVECEPSAEPVYVDREMWEKIVLNLISNAFKYTLTGEVEVGLHPAPEGDGVELTVRDTGAGIPAAELPRVFERFHRIEGQTGRTAEGSGIGLALVSELVRLHAGRISVESAAGRGSTFKVWLPAGAAHLPPERVNEESASASTRVSARAFVQEALRWLANEPAPEITSANELEGRASGSAAAERARVLIADDNADMRDYLRRLLGDIYEVEAAADGIAAMEIARRWRPELILSDVMMPRLDGFGVLREIRADAELHDTPVILLSARAGEEASVEGLERGADDYLVKPFSARELLARIATNLDFARRQRQAQLELQRINESLEQQVVAEVAERMKAEAAYRQAQKMEVVGQLTGGIAHDFNNLLQVISGNLHVMQQRSAAGKLTPEDIERLSEAAVRGAERAASLTRRLLAFSRRQPLDPKPLDVNRLVSGMIELLRRTLGESIRIETRAAADLWMTLADTNELENALLNLAINARDAMPEGGRLSIVTANAVIDTALITTDGELSAGDYVSISVIDNGTGMTKEVAEKAFEPFFTTKGVGQGTGLGLSQVYGFVRQSEGHVNIESAPGAGTTVRIYLPRLKVQAASEAEEAASKPVATSGSGQSVLLVEDDADVRELTATILRELGYIVIEAGDGASALEILGDGKRIDLVMTDIGLPGALNGRQLAEQVRAHQPEQKVLFVSGYERSTIVHNGRLDPGIELLTKPFTVSQLAAKLREMLGDGTPPMGIKTN